MAEEKSIQTKPIPELIFISGEEVTLDFTQHFKAAEGDVLSFEAMGLPENFKLDPKTGVVSGKVPNVFVNVPYLCCIKAISENTKEKVSEFFSITILSSAVPFEAVGSGGAYMDLFNPNIEIDKQTLELWVQYIIEQHYASVYFMDSDNPPENVGKLIDLKQSKSGFNIYLFERAIGVTSGKKAFNDGNPARLTQTLEEVYEKYIDKMKWETIGLMGSDNRTITKAWVIGRLYEKPMGEPPSNKALRNLRNLRNLRGELPITTKKPLPQG